MFINDEHITRKYNLFKMFKQDISNKDHHYQLFDKYCTLLSDVTENKSTNYSEYYLKDGKILFTYYNYTGSVFVDFERCDLIIDTEKKYIFYTIITDLFDIDVKTIGLDLSSIVNDTLNDLY